MRRILLVALVTLGAAAAVALAAPSGQTDRMACNVKKIDFYFWPAGHGAIPKLGFPAFAPPHMEIYKAKSVANSAQLGFMNANGAVLEPGASIGAATIGA